MGQRLLIDFFGRDVLELAPDLLGKKIVRNLDGETFSYYISEVEAYRGSEDLACHASKGRTSRTEAMYLEGGHIYMYFIYGMYWMFNIVAAEAGVPQAVLIRSLRGIKGPGRVSRELMLDRSFYGVSLLTSDRIWLENGESAINYSTGLRVGVEYAGNYWKNKEWRFFVNDNQIQQL